MNLSENQKNIILNVLRPYHPVSVGIFGSYARGEETKNSDLDLLVDFEKALNLFILMDIEESLFNQLGIKIDLITVGSLNTHIKPFILKDLKLIN